MSERTRSGNVIPHSSTCMPPIEPPITLNHAGTPRCVAKRAWARTMSRMVTTGKRGPVLGAGRRVDRGRAGRALAAADHVRAHDEVAVGVERHPRADHALPPSARGMPRPDGTGDVAVAGPGVADEDGVGARAVERPPGLVGDGHVAQRAPAFEGERAVGRQPQELATAGRIAGTPGGAHGRRAAHASSSRGRTARFGGAPRDGSVVAGGSPATSPPALLRMGWHLGLPSQVAGPSPSGWMVRAALDASPQR